MTKLNSSSTSEPSDLLYLKKIISNASFQTKATQKLKMNNVSIVTRRNFITLLDEIRGAPRGRSGCHNNSAQKYFGAFFGLKLGNFAS
jgi:hypothetical protein